MVAASLKNGAPLISTERLVLRHLDDRDLDKLHEMLSDAKTMQYYRRTYDRLGAKRWLESIYAGYQLHGYSFFAAERRTDGAFVGQIGLLHWDDVDGRVDVEVAYMLHRNYWGCGYATEAARACRDWGFNHLGLDRVVSFIAVENLPSIAVAVRNGMRQVKRLETNRFGVPIFVYAIDRHEWSTSAIRH